MKMDHVPSSRMIQSPVLAKTGQFRSGYTAGQPVVRFACRSVVSGSGGSDWDRFFLHGVDAAEERNSEKHKKKPDFCRSRVK